VREEAQAAATDMSSDATRERLAAHRPGPNAARGGAHGDFFVEPRDPHPYGSRQRGSDPAGRNGVDLDVVHCPRRSEPSRELHFAPLRTPGGGDRDFCTEWLAKKANSDAVHSAVKDTSSVVGAVDRAAMIGYYVMCALTLVTIGAHDLDLPAGTTARLPALN